MSARTYLYGYGRRKHIASGAPGRGGGAPAFCGNWFRDEVATLGDYRRWMGPEQAEQRMAKQRAFPVCKACEKAAPAADQPMSHAELETVLRETLAKAQRVSSILCQQRDDGRWTWLWSEDSGAIGCEDVDPRLLPYLEAGR